MKPQYINRWEILRQVYILLREKNLSRDGLPIADRVIERVENIHCDVDKMIQEELQCE